MWSEHGSSVQKKKCSGGGTWLKVTVPFRFLQMLGG